MRGGKEQSVIDYLLEKILSGEYSKGKKIPSEYRLADKFQINKGTANRAVSYLVSQGYLQRTRGAGGTVVLENRVFPRYRFVYVGIMGGPHSYYPLLLRGVARMSFDCDCILECFPISGQTDTGRLCDRLRRMNPDAVFIGGMTPSLNLPDVPVIFIDTYPFAELPNYYWVNSDNHAGGKLLAAHLYNSGHRKIACCTGMSPIQVHGERLRGVTERGEELGMTVDKVHFGESELFSSSPFFFEKIYDRIIGKYSAAVFNYDIVAADFIGFCGKKKISVPDDISVASFCCNREFHHFAKITSIDVHPEEIGNYAVMKALEILERKNDVSSGELTPVSLFSGDTVKTLPV